MLFIKKEYNGHSKNVQINKVDNFVKYINNNSLAFQIQFNHSRSLTTFEYDSLRELEEAILKLEYVIRTYDKGVYELDAIIIPNYIDELEMLRNVEKTKMKNVYDIGGNL